jgi:hypothetical protein
VPVNTAPAPGARLQFANERVFAWLGFKASQLLNINPEVNQQVAVWAVLGGVSVDVVQDHFRIDVNGGYFNQGTNPNLYSTQIVMPGQHYRDYTVDTAGASFQLSVFDGVSPTGSLDYALYKNDPTTAVRYFAPPDYKPGFHWLAQSEFTVITQQLQDADNTSSTTRQLAYAGDINLRAQWGHARFKVDAVLQSLSFLLLNQPSLVPYQAFPAAAVITPDRFIAAGFDYNFRRIGLTLGPTLGIDFPATFTPPSGAVVQQLCGNTMGSLCSPATLVVRGEGNYSILPEKDASGNAVGPVPVLAAKLVVREDFLDYFALILDLYYTHDGNQTHLVTDPSSGTYKRDFNGPAIDQLGFNLTLQARF